MQIVLIILVGILLLGPSTHNPFSGIHVDSQKDGFVVSAEDASLSEIIEEICWSTKRPCHTENINEKINFPPTFFKNDEWQEWLNTHFQINFYPATQTFKSPKQTKHKIIRDMYKPSFQKPSELKKKLQKSIESNRVILKDIDVLNTLYIYTNIDKMTDIKQLAQKLDCQPPHILAKIDVISVSSEALRDLGVDVFGTWLKLSHNQILGLELLKKITILETKGQASYLAKPTSILLPNQKMTIKNLEKTKGVTQPATLDLSMQFDFQGNEGIFATFELKHVYLTNNQFTEHQFKNNTLLINNEVSLIGGLREKNIVFENHCFPWIGEIPILANLLCRTTTHNKDQVVLLFIHPQRLQRCVPLPQ